MTDLETILQAIDHLPESELNKVRQHIDQRTHHIGKALNMDVENWITNLHAAIDDFREGLSEAELGDIVSSMNIGYISPKELRDLQEIMDWAEDED